MFIQRFKHIEKTIIKKQLSGRGLQEAKDNDRQLPKLRESGLFKWFKVPKFTPTGKNWHPLATDKG